MFVLKAIWTVLITFCITTSVSAAVVVSPPIASSTTTGVWHPILLPVLNPAPNSGSATPLGSIGVGDYYDDQQTGDHSSDIVGNTVGTTAGTDPGAYMAFFGDAGSSPNGELAF